MSATQIIPGSARASRADFGASPKSRRRKNFATSNAPLSAREARAFP